MIKQLTTAAIIKALGKALPKRYHDDQLGARIRKRRREWGLLQRELAFRGCGAGNLSRIERGEYSPAFDLVLKLCLILDLNPAYLCWGRGIKQLQPERERYILEFLGLPERELRALLNRRRKS